MKFYEVVYQFKPEKAEKIKINKNKTKNKGEKKQLQS